MTDIGYTPIDTKHTATNHDAAFLSLIQQRLKDAEKQGLIVKGRYEAKRAEDGSVFIVDHSVEQETVNIQPNLNRAARRKFDRANKRKWVADRK